MLRRRLLSFEFVWQRTAGHVGRGEKKKPLFFFGAGWKSHRRVQYCQVSEPQKWFDLSLCCAKGSEQHASDARHRPRVDTDIPLHLARLTDRWVRGACLPPRDPCPSFSRLPGTPKPPFSCPPPSSACDARNDGSALPTFTRRAWVGREGRRTERRESERGRGFWRRVHRWSRESRRRYRHGGEACLPRLVFTQSTRQRQERNTLLAVLDSQNSGRAVNIRRGIVGSGDTLGDDQGVFEIFDSFSFFFFVFSSGSPKKGGRRRAKASLLVAIDDRRRTARGLDRHPGHES